MLFSDFLEKNNEIDFAQWFHKLNKNQFIWGVYTDFFLILKEYFNSKGIQLVIIWDQINVLYRNTSKTKKGYTFFEDLTESYTFFNYIILSASNDNEEINIENEKIRLLEINPFEVFQKHEFINLIQSEIDLWNLIPSDIKKNNASEYRRYISYLSEILNYSIS